MYVAIKALISMGSFSGALGLVLVAACDHGRPPSHKKPIAARHAHLHLETGRDRGRGRGA